MISAINTKLIPPLHGLFDVFHAAPHASCCFYDGLPLAFHFVLLPAGG